MSSQCEADPRRCVQVGYKQGPLPTSTPFVGQQGCSRLNQQPQDALLNHVSVHARDWAHCAAQRRLRNWPSHRPAADTVPESGSPPYFGHKAEVGGLRCCHHQTELTGSLPMTLAALPATPSPSHKPNACSICRCASWC
jgi:hypothetical protein